MTAVRKFGDVNVRYVQRGTTARGIDTSFLMLTMRDVAADVLLALFCVEYPQFC